MVKIRFEAGRTPLSAIHSTVRGNVRLTDGINQTLLLSGGTRQMKWISMGVNVSLSPLYCSFYVIRVSKQLPADKRSRVRKRNEYRSRINLRGSMRCWSISRIRQRIRGRGVPSARHSNVNDAPLRTESNGGLGRKSRIRGGTKRDRKTRSTCTWTWREHYLEQSRRCVWSFAVLYWFDIDILLGHLRWRDQ